jgi:NitT/TauT family transport system substrate-binding protein
MIFPRRNIFLLAAALLVGAFLSQPLATAQPRDTIKVVVISYLSYAPIFIAKEEDFFTAEGIDVELLQVTRVSTAIPALIQGDIDVLPAAIMPSYFNIIDRGGMMKVVAGKGYNSPDACAYSGIMARRSLLESGELSSAKDMAGRRVSTERTSPSYYRFNKFLVAAGLTLDDLIVIDIPAAAKFDAFETGALDVATASEPWVTRYKRAGNALLWSRTSDHLPGFQFGHLLFGKSLLVDNPEAGQRFVLAYLKAVRHLNAEGKSERHIEILAKYTGLDKDLLAEACWPPLRHDGRAQADSLDAYQHWALEQGLVDHIVPIETLYDSRFIERANRLLAEETDAR